MDVTLYEDHLADEVAETGGQIPAFGRTTTASLLDSAR